MVLRALAVVVLFSVPVPPAKTPVNVRAECMKACAGAPKEASGAHLLECLHRCEAASSSDGGVP